MNHLRYNELHVKFMSHEPFTTAEAKEWEDLNWSKAKEILPAFLFVDNDITPC